MYKLIQKLRFFCRAQTAHGLHSPLVYDLYSQVINPHLWNFNSISFEQDLINYISNKPELKDHKLMTICNLYEFKSFKPQSNQIVLILDSYKNKSYQEQVNDLAKDPSYTYIIHFFKGSIFIANHLAPRQEFYLKHMQ